MSDEKKPGDTPEPGKKPLHVTFGGAAGNDNEKPDEKPDAGARDADFEFNVSDKKPERETAKEAAPEQRAFDAAANDHVALKKLLDGGVDANARDGEGATLLHHAARNGNLMTLKTLLDAGAEVNATDRLEETPLDQAVLWGRNDTRIPGGVTAVLRAKGAKTGAELLMSGALKGDSTLAKLQADGAVSSAGLDKPYGDGGDTVLLRIAREGDFENLVKALGADKKELGYDALTRRGEKGQNVVDVLGRHGRLETLFTPDLWTGRVAEMGKLWDAVPDAYKKDVKYDALVQKTRVQSIRRRPKLGRGKPPKQ